MLYPTMEVRWFGQGAVPSDVETWFSRLEGPTEAEPSRIDYYLAGTEQGSQGIKWRSAKLEVKWRRRSHGVVRFAESISGNIEQWCKLSAACDDDKGAGQLREDEAWIAVEKRRILRKYELRHDAEIIAVHPRNRPPAACNLELTRLAMAGKAWWTIGFETVGDEQAQLDLLQRVARHAFAGNNNLALSADDSYGYPHWLSHAEHAMQTG